MHPRTRWCATLLGPDGTAVAHGCARGPHPWIPPADERQRNRDGPDPRQDAALAGFLRDLNITFTPIAKDSCDHATAGNRYTPSRKLKHLVRARTATCPAPGCAAQAYHNEIDHTLPYPAGPTCQCNLGPPADATTGSSTPLAGHSPSPNPASCAGPRPPDAPTPPARPSTKCDRAVGTSVGQGT